ncbi:carbohydrate kinase [Aurantibacter crassamenti]|uniref:FGGY-family carbohydrate kinase n=1 Tax=Aurantibacter crassamenti TaxID=1837375 RepID=UPI00193A0B15|nr:FGGY family carbohydrate kinase [Aurantibacter crassamenti]MBM1105793.1 carbohydrate kinase [Aurantibacter crassamenti]
MKKKVTAIFDIGRTNKKFFLFDKNFREVYREYIRLDEIEDEDGFPAENLEALENWTKEVLDRMLNSKEYDIQKVNFSSYGASMVHIDENGKAILPLYNYLKPLPKEISETFYNKYGPENELTRVTGSPKFDMLNSGMQLYWIKQTKPEVFKKIKYSLHLPQYISYLFTGVPVSDNTSIGCHTLLWDYEKNAYHNWVCKEGLDEKLAPIMTADNIIFTTYNGKTIKMGVGIHDSSSALLPYVRSSKKTFVLVSTGTWSISINPFATDMLSETDIINECFFNMRVDGKPTKVSRLFLGNEYKLQMKVLSSHYNVPEDYHKTIKFDKNIFSEIDKDFECMFHWCGIISKDMPSETKLSYDKFEYAYHQLMIELLLLQVASIKSANSSTNVKRIFVDGGFSDNDVYIQLLTHYLPQMKLKTTDSSLGSALGAAIVISDKTLKPKFLKKNYSLKKQVPFIDK